MDHFDRKLRESLACGNYEMHFIGPGKDEGFGINHDNAIVGLATNEDDEDVVVYDLNIILQNLMDEGMSDEGALEFYEYNIERSLPYCGNKAPVIIRGLSGF